MTRASIASILVQLKHKDADGKRGAKVPSRNGGKPINWILEFALAKGGVWPKVS